MLKKKKEMSLGKLNSLIMIAVLALAAVSCKDDDETPATPQLSGLTFSCPSFVSPKERVTITPKGLVPPEDGVYGIYFKVTPTMSWTDTTRYLNGLDNRDESKGKPSDGTKVFEFSDTLGTYTVTFYAFSPGYAGDSYSKEVTVVKAGLDGSLTGTGIKASDKHITAGDTDYYYTRVGSLDWMRNNLSSRDGGAPFANHDVMSGVFGRYYSHEDALNACPEGWRLPSEADWVGLGKALGDGQAKPMAPIADVAAKLMADVSFNGVQMWEYWPEVGDITDASGLAVIPAGFANLGLRQDDSYPQASFEGLNEYAAFWTADKVDGEEGMAYYRYLVVDQPDLFVGKGDARSFGASVRCVRDAE